METRASENLVIGAASGPVLVVAEHPDDLTPRSVGGLDPRYLFSNSARHGDHLEARVVVTRDEPRDTR